VRGLFEQVFLLNRKFCTQLAPQQIKTPLPQSAQIQEQQGALVVSLQALCCVRCKTAGPRTISSDFVGCAYVEHHYFNKHMTLCHTLQR